ncbi:MAG: FMN-binding negative transcriptional regulator, partial [Propionibacteriaceae bacterium]|nr:FMN-binding negative transcriptional regulator [Propionibacteriaceae bacterium]
MYIPEHFRMPDADVRAFLQQVRTGTLITTDLRTRRPLATFLPWVMTGDDRLTSHMGSVNPQSHDSDPDAEALVILMGYDGFVPADWMGPGAAPTLDYETVHVYGHLTTHTDADWILQSWDDLLRTFSHTTLQEYDHDWLVKNARAVVGIEID